MAKALTVPSLSSPARSVSFAEYSRVPAAFTARQLGLVPISTMPLGDQRAAGAIDVEEVDAAAIPGRQIDLRRQRVAKRGAEGADIREEGPGGLGRPSPDRETSQGGHARQRSCCFQK